MRTLIIDDERLARRELRSLLKFFPTIEIIGECSNAEEGIAAIANATEGPKEPKSFEDIISKDVD